MFKLNTRLAEQLRPVAHRNEQHMREQAAKARQRREFGYAKQIDLQAKRWKDITVDGPQTR